MKGIKKTRREINMLTDAQIADLRDDRFATAKILEACATLLNAAGQYSNAELITGSVARIVDLQAKKESCTYLEPSPPTVLTKGSEA